MTKSNKEIALEVLTRAFTDRDPTVVEQLFSVNYKQHNPAIPDGPAAIAKMIPTLTNLRYEPGMAGVGGDLLIGPGRHNSCGAKAHAPGGNLSAHGGQVCRARCSLPQARWRCLTTQRGAKCSRT